MDTMGGVQDGQLCDEAQRCKREGVKVEVRGVPHGIVAK
jgi:hypothetical protein